MRILIISYMFPPELNPRALRWGSIARYWARVGHEVDVVCHGTDGSREELFGRLRVHQVRSGGWLGRLRERLSGQPRVAAGGKATASAARRGRPLLRAAQWVYHRSLGLIHWPDYAWLWLSAAQDRAHALLSDRPYDAMITVSNPFTDHLAGLEVWKTLSSGGRRPGAVWIADIGDPFAYFEEAPPNNRLLYRGRNQRSEDGVLSNADIVTVTMPSMVTAYAEWFPAHRGKFRVVPPLLTLPGPPAFKPESDPRLPGRRLAYVGTLYRKVRNPRPVLELFRRLLDVPGLSDLHLDFYGRTEDCRGEFRPFRDLVGRRVHLHGSLPHEAVWSRIRACHALVNIGNTLTCGLPSKVVEYAYSGRPILNVTPHEHDTSASFLSGHPAALSVVGDAALSDPAEFDRVVRFLAAPPVAGRSEIGALLAPHRLDAVAGAYEQHIRQALLANGQAIPGTIPSGLPRSDWEARHDDRANAA